MHVCNIRQRKLRLHMLRFSAVRTNCHDTSQRLIWQTESKRCCLYLHFTVTTSYCSAGTDGHHALQSFSICKSTINLLYNIDVMDFVNTQPTNNDLLHELLAVGCAEQNRAPTARTIFAGCSEPHRPRQR